MYPKYFEIKKVETVTSDEAVNALLRHGWVLLDTYHRSVNEPVKFILGFKGEEEVTPDSEPTDAEILKACKQFFVGMGWAKLWRAIEKSLAKQTHEPTDVEILKVCNQLFIELGLEKFWCVIIKNPKQAH